MLTEILRSVQRFEREHGEAPNVVYLNPDHWQALMHELPGLRGAAAVPTPLGFHVLILPREDLVHPRSARLPLGLRRRGARESAVRIERCDSAA